MMEGEAVLCFILCYCHTVIDFHAHTPQARNTILELPALRSRDRDKEADHCGQQRSLVLANTIGTKKTSRVQAQCIRVGM